MGWEDVIKEGLQEYVTLTVKRRKEENHDKVVAAMEKQLYLLDKSDELVIEMRSLNEKQALDRFKEELEKQPSRSGYWIDGCNYQDY